MSQHSQRFKWWLIAGMIMLGGVLLFSRGVWFPGEMVVTHASEVVLAPGELPVYFHNRPPYYYDSGSGVTGLVATPVRKALDVAGIEHRWILVPASRQLDLIRDNTRPAAAIGWFRTEERAEFAVFSQPIYQDKPLVVVTRKDNTAILADMSLEALFSDRSQAMLAKESYSYGVGLDEAMALFSPRRQSTSADNAATLLMISEGRADYCLMAPEEARDLLGESHPEFSDLHVVRLEAMPVGNMRYMMFSPAVSADIIERFNAVLGDQL